MKKTIEQLKKDRASIEYIIKNIGTNEADRICIMSRADNYYFKIDNDKVIDLLHYRLAAIDAEIKAATQEADNYEVVLLDQIIEKVEKLSTLLKTITTRKK